MYPKASQGSADSSKIQFSQVHHAIKSLPELFPASTIFVRSRFWALIWFKSPSTNAHRSNTSAIGSLVALPGLVQLRVYLLAPRAGSPQAILHAHPGALRSNTPFKVRPVLFYSGTLPRRGCVNHLAITRGMDTRCSERNQT